MRLRNITLILLIAPVVAPLLFLVLSNKAPLPGPRPDPLQQPFPGLLVPLFLFLGPIGFVLWLFRRFDKALGQLVAATKDLAAGALTQPIQIAGTVEINSLTRSLEELRVALNQDRERKSFLLMGLSHDFRTPLALIQGYTEAIEDEIGTTNSACSHYLSIISDKTRHLERMVDRWIELVRLETGERVATFEDVLLAPWLTGLWNRFRADVEMMGRRFSGDITLDPQISVRLDPELMERVLENLLSNSLKYTEPGHRICWEVRRHTDQIVIDLEDEGRGISPPEAHLIWEPFYRSKDQSRLGWGLGLSIVKSIVVAHGFKIKLEPTESGRGTRFQILIPLSDVSTAEVRQTLEG